MSIFRTLLVPQYWNFYVTALIAMALFPVLIGLPYMCFINWLQETPVDWQQWMLRVGFGIVVGVVFGLWYHYHEEYGKFDFSSYTEIYHNLLSYPGGEEISHSFDAMVPEPGVGTQLQD